MPKLKTPFVSYSFLFSILFDEIKFAYFITIYK